MDSLEKKIFQFGGVAQMVERFVSIEEAAGSMPAFSTFSTERDS